MRKLLSVLVLLCIALIGYGQSSLTETITNNCPGNPPAAFTIAPDTVFCGNKPITFTAPIAPGLSYRWDFGDPNSAPLNTATTNPATHRFKGNPLGPLLQPLTVRLIITNTTGCEDTVERIVTLRQTPKAALSVIGGTGQGMFEGIQYFTACDLTSATFTFSNQSQPAVNSNHEIIWGDNGVPPNYISGPGTGPLNEPHLYFVGNDTLFYIVTGSNNTCTDTAVYGIFVGAAPSALGGISSNNPSLTGCTGATFSFPFSPFSFLNPDGTIYLIEVDDGSPDTTFTQANLPAVYYHTFNIPSCNVGGQPNVNFFTVKYTVSNPCGIGLTGTIGPIRISRTPVADFIIRDTVCTNQPVLFTDISSNTYVNGANCGPGKSIWSITPGSSPGNWMPLGGASFGSDGGSPLLPSAWTTANPNPMQVEFFTPGVYSINLRTGGKNECGIDDTTKIICVNLPPVANFSFTSDTLCSGLTDTVLYTPVPAACGIYTYEWSVINYVSAAGCFPNTQNYSYVDGTDSSFSNPHFQFISPGTYTIQLIAYSPARSCSATVQKNVVVKGKPVISLPASDSLCQNQCINLVNPASCFITNATYLWTFNGSNGSSPSNLPSPGPICYPTAGTFNIILDVTNECETSSDTVLVVVDSLISALAGSDTTLCGTSITMAANSPGTATGIWSMVSGPLPAPTFTSPGSPTTTISGLNPGTYIFQWKIINGGCADSSRVTVNIAPGPTTANAGPDQNLCLAISTNLAASTPLVGTGTWTFISGPNLPPVVNIQSPTSPTSTVSGLIPGVYIFTWTTTFSNCSQSIDSVRITIYDTPDIANAGSDVTICTSTHTLNANNPVTGIGEWSILSGPPGASILPPTLNTATISPLVSGTYTLIWKIRNDPCPPNLDTIVISVSPISNNIINANQAICINTIPATITGGVPTGGNGSYTYQWEQSPNAGGPWSSIPAPGGTGIDYSPGALSSPTCYRRIVKTTLCPLGDVSAPVCITINPDSKALFTASATLLCAPVNLDTIISATLLPLQNAQYYWYHDNILIPGPTNGSPPFYPILTAGQTVVIKLVTTSLFGCRMDSMSITFNTRPAVMANFTKDKTDSCGPLTVNFTNTSSILNNSIEFYWDFGNGTTLSNVQQPPNPVVYLPSPLFRDTTYFITLKAYSGCDTSTKIDSIKIFANPKARFTSITSGCSPFKDTIINNSFGHDAFTIYYWDFGDNTRDTLFTTGTIYHTYNTGIITTFTIRLIMANRCGRDTQYFNVVVSPITIQPLIAVTGSAGCVGQSVVFQNASVGAAYLEVNYGDGSAVDIIPNWQSTFTHNYAAGTYTASIKLINNCTDTTITRQVSIYPKPVASFTIANPLVCWGQPVFTTNTSVNANSFEWLWGDGTNSNPPHVYASPGIYLIRLVARRTNNFGIVCTDTSAPVQVHIVAKIPAVINITSSPVYCAPYIFTADAMGASGATSVNWYFYDNTVTPGIFEVTGASASYQFLNPGTFTVKLLVTDSAGCKDSSIISVTINKKPVVADSAYTIKTCNTDTTIRFFTTVNYSGTDPLNYQWFINDSPVGTGNPLIYQFTAPSGITASNIFNVKVLVRNAAGCGDTTLIRTVIIQTIGNRDIVVSPRLVLDAPEKTFTFTDTAFAFPNSTYTWYIGDQNGQILSGNPITHSYSDTGAYHVKLIVKDYETSCIAIDSVTVYINYVPGYLYVPNAFCPACGPLGLRQFLPLGKGLRDYHLIIRNIWGQVVFETRSLGINGIPNEPWDGNWRTNNANKINVKQDAYAWFIEAHYINGTEWKGMLNPKTNRLEKEGPLTILR